MFYQLNLDFNQELDIFNELCNSIKFEHIAKGRIGANCFVSIDNDCNYIPLVRTTTIYSNPIQKFTSPFITLINQIKSQVYKLYNINVGELNNGLVEIYTHEYKTMGFHSDQSLDLESDSWICIFSTYSNPESFKSSLRKLVVQSKLTNQQTEYNLTHNSVIIFDTNTNNTHLHKIILSNSNNEENSNKWFGITFRTSKIFIKFIESKPYILDNMDELILATPEEKKEFYKLKSQENKSIGFRYPYINYTISPSDLRFEI